MTITSTDYKDFMQAHPECISAARITDSDVAGDGCDYLDVPSSDDDAEEYSDGSYAVLDMDTWVDRQSDAAQLDHVLQRLLNLPPNSVLARALDQNGITSVPILLGLDFDSLEYQEDDGHGHMVSHKLLRDPQ